MQPPPPGGWQAQPPPPGGWQGPPPGGPGSGEIPPGEGEGPIAETAAPGLTEEGIPVAMRGGLRLEIARLSGDDEDFAYGTLDVVAQFRLGKRSFFDARLPLTVGSLGNPTLGGHGVLRPSNRLWITLGGAVGLPLVGSDDELVAEGAYAQALWNLHEYAIESFPFMFQFGIEGHFGEVGILRAEVDPLLLVRLDPQSGDNALDLGIQHALELQLGHAVGGGLRLQGVWLATSGRDENYQLALEPFFALERESMFLRLGVLLPFNGPIGFTLDDRARNTAWGVRAATGIHFD